MTARRSRRTTRNKQRLAVLETRKKTREASTTGELVAARDYALGQIEGLTKEGETLTEFRPGAELLEFIGKPLLVSPNPEAVEVYVGPAGHLKLVRLEIPPDYHRDSRVIAAKQETTMAILVRKLVQDFIDHHRKAGKV